ncbi:MAG: glycosyltransferase family 2 protein [Cytophagales bacterium]|nr:glycosyltransferase family 2 protein [Cytophagales bacterium]
MEQQFSRANAKVSVIVITKNEAHNIAACLASASFADEVIVLDSGSTDATVALARASGAAVHQTTDWPGFGAQKNRALALATGDWVLSLDADERVPDALKLEIQQCLAKAQSDDANFCAFDMPRSSSYCGQLMRHSGWYPDRVLRLFKRGAAQFSDDTVHESLRVQAADAKIGHLTNALLHESFANFESVLDKVNRYSTASAKALQAKGRKATFGSALGHGLWAFFRTYVLRLGFLDGRLGLALAISNAEGTYYRYLKLWLLQQQNQP